MSHFFRFLGVQAGEGPLAAGLFSYALLIGVGRVFVLTSSQALFLQSYAAADLAYVYIGAALATIAASAAYLWLGRRLSLRDLLLVNLTFTLSVTVLLRIFLGITSAAWPAMALAAWFHVMFALSSFAFWGAATRVVDIRQGKRLFTVATTGDVLAFSLGGLFILRSVDRLGTANLLWIGAAGFALSIVALLFTLSRSSIPLGGTERRRSTGSSGREVRWSSPYLRLMMGYFVLSAAVFVFLDNAFNDVAQRRFEGAAELARFFATYSAVAAIVNFFFRSLVAGRLVRRFGLVVGLAALPVVVGLGAASVGLSGTLLPGLAFVFWFTTATRLSDKILRGVQQSSMATLYQPLGERGAAVQTTMDGIIDSAAIGLCGVLLLVLHRVFEIGAVELSYLLLAACAIWFVVAVGLKREFVHILEGALHHRRLRGEAIDLVDDDARGLVKAQLASAYPEQVVYALGLLAEAEDPELPALIEGLLDHEVEEVRIEALRLIASRHLTRTRDRVAALVRDSRLSHDLRGAAMCALGQLSEDTPAELLEALESDEAALRRGAMVGLLRSGSIEGIVYAGARLLEDLESGQAEARILGAEVLRDAALPNLFRQVVRLLADPDPDVRARAVEAAGAMDHPELWPRVVDALGDRRLAPVASETLLKAGPAVISFLMDGYARDPDDRHRRLAALKILRLLGGEEAVRALLPLIETRDREEREAVLGALAHCELDAAPDEVEALTRQLEVEVEDAADAFAALGDIDGAVEGEAMENLIGSLEEEIRGARHRIFLILSFLRPGSDLLTAWENYVSGTRDRRAYALELLDSHLEARERGRLFPLLEEQGLDERLEALSRSHTVRRLPARERVEQLARREDLSSWTRLCARRVGSEIHADVAAFRGAEAELYRRTSRLRRVGLFGDIPGAVLARTVPRLQDMSLGPGETVFRKGDEGDGMYVVLEGRVRVHDAERELAVLSSDAVFGEFTVLQRMPRTASVTTLDSTLLLKFTQEDLQELIRERAAVARALIGVILSRLLENREAVSPAAPAAPG